MLNIEKIEKHDLAISLEVAEHIEKKYATNFIDTICKTADIVIFSAAVSHQGGSNHINEQPQSYWVEKFSKNDYLAYDFFRPHFWTEEEIAVWYRQNMFLFVKKGAEKRFKKDISPYLFNQQTLIDSIHPQLYQMKILAQLREISGREALKMAVKKLFKRLLFLK